MQRCKRSMDLQRYPTSNMATVIEASSISVNSLQSSSCIAQHLVEPDMSI